MDFSIHSSPYIVLISQSLSADASPGPSASGHMPKGNGGGPHGVGGTPPLQDPQTAPGRGAAAVAITVRAATSPQTPPTAQALQYQE